ncbi:MAG TPA: hypothetical protein VLR90_04620, partial [Blastocatellia bacterium]|nr:hypothetical protein [Blastocatellia bacterium]
MNGAYLLGSTADERERIFRFLKKVYDQRSSLAHGRASEQAIRVNGIEYSFPAFIRELGEIVRKIIRTFLESTES